MPNVFCPTCDHEFVVGVNEIEEGDRCPNCRKDSLTPVLEDPYEDLCDE